MLDTLFRGIFFLFNFLFKVIITIFNSIFYRIRVFFKFIFGNIKAEKRFRDDIKRINGDRKRLLKLNDEIL